MEKRIQSQESSATGPKKVVQETVDVILRNISERPIAKEVAEQFLLWLRAIEEVGAIEEWRGLNEGREGLTEEEIEDRDEALFKVFCYELKREGIAMTDFEIQEGYLFYKND